MHEINVYGSRKVAAEKILRDGKVRAGEPLPASKGDMEDRIAEIPGVLRARVEAVCCEGTEVLLFIGIEERDGPHVAFHSEPAGQATLPDELKTAYRQFLALVQRAAAQQQPSALPNLPQVPDKAAREFEQKFIAHATAHLAELRDVLRNSAEPEERAVAAAVIGYAPKKTEVVDDIQYATQDPDESVRSNAIRSLHALAVLEVRDPGLGIRISPTWLIELLNSLVLSDRLQAADTLLTLTEGRDRAILDQMRARALPSLVEMARWESLSYALRPFLLVGRLSGLSEQVVQQRWSSGQRQTVIDRVLGVQPARRK